jgi:hypothetical protein
MHPHPSVRPHAIVCGMSVLCSVGLHRWGSGEHGCRCARRGCDASRHLLEKCKCSRCRTSVHQYEGLKCAVCGVGDTSQLKGLLRKHPSYSIVTKAYLAAGMGCSADELRFEMGGATGRYRFEQQREKTKSIAESMLEAVATAAADLPKETDTESPDYHYLRAAWSIRDGFKGGAEYGVLEEVARWLGTGYKYLLSPLESEISTAWATARQVLFHPDRYGTSDARTSGTEVYHPCCGILWAVEDNIFPPWSMRY